VEVKEIIQKCLEGDRGAWKMLVDLYSKKIFNLAYQFAGSYQEAEDLTQDIFLKLFKSLNKYDFDHDFTAWLLTLARNYLIDEFRKNRWEKSQRTELNENIMSSDDTVHPEAQYLNQEKAALVWEGLQQLSSELRVTLVLREIEGLSYEEIASKLNLPLGTVKSRVNRGRLQLAQVILEKTGGKL
jgi:RNA polymerase sigma-70 factor (ECF subfamily)